MCIGFRARTIREKDVTGYITFLTWFNDKTRDLKSYQDALFLKILIIWKIYNLIITFQMILGIFQNNG